MVNLSVYQGKVLKILNENPDSQDLQISVNYYSNVNQTNNNLNNHYHYFLTRAKLYKSFCTPARIGDIVLINRTAQELALGTGGLDYVISNLSFPSINHFDKGHIMKLRYTPLQFGVQTIEETQEYKIKERNFNDLNGTPVAVGELHSMLMPFTVAIKKLRPQWKIAYIMTDAGALPMQFSKAVTKLKAEGLLDHTITTGNAFGGEIETVNLFSALITAYSILKVDIVVILMGPGIVGTGTKYGFSGIEQLFSLYAIDKLSGRKYLIPRVNFQDNRVRHQGLSHHTLTILSHAYNINLTFPTMGTKYEGLLLDQLTKDQEIAARHTISWINGKECHGIFKNSGLQMETMGRKINDEPKFFETIWVTAKKIVME
ncbi:DUF3866 family protein [Natranaerobius thermophilus]|uniref:DUF3866 domain-containing protein n=1 Tax=Natranaerobius thermophilus (strain ATCC BAA-1301 / DSM 18059 / JW/NM-WN-LF) TaxID=457570 RepID=B2A506_NATTJ|nr:DUF3866 family protein [Natranaerobius thermophilus]ACB85248.1 conserved hypothetical protein [Natranaerobius thermophilus JW/NM-WN-LF]